MGREDRKSSKLEAESSERRQKTEERAWGGELEVGGAALWASRLETEGHLARGTERKKRIVAAQ